MCDTSPLPRVRRKRAENVCWTEDKEREIVGKLIREARHPKFLISFSLSALISANIHLYSQRHRATICGRHKWSAAAEIYGNMSRLEQSSQTVFGIFMFGNGLFMRERNSIASACGRSYSLLCRK